MSNGKAQPFLETKANAKSYDLEETFHRSKDPNIKVKKGRELLAFPPALSIQQRITSYFLR